MKKLHLKRAIAFMLTVMCLVNLVPLQCVNAGNSIKLSASNKTDSETNDASERNGGGFTPNNIELEGIEEEPEYETEITLEKAKINYLIPDNEIEQENFTDNNLTEDLQETSECENTSINSSISAEDIKTSELIQLDKKFFEISKGTGKFEYIDGKDCFVIRPEIYLNEYAKSVTTDKLNIKYKIYKILNESQNSVSSCNELLSEGCIECGKGIENSAVIEYNFENAGKYEIYIYDEQDTYIDKITYNIESPKQKIKLKKSTVNLKYGEKLYVGGLIDIVKDSEYDLGEECIPLGVVKEYEITLKNEADKKVLNIGDGYIEAIGVNGSDKGTAIVKIKIKGTEFVEESNEVELKVYIDKISPVLKISANDETDAYNKLAVGILLTKADETNISELLLDERAYIAFSVDLLSYTTENTVFNEKGDYIDSRNLETNENGEYMLPITADFFNSMSSMSKYTLTAQLRYDEDAEKGVYAPFDFVSAQTNISVRGSQIGLQTSLEGNGQFNYRSDYGKTANLTVTVEDVEALDKNSVIEYQITSSDTDIIDKKENKKYSNKDNIVPLLIKGVGTTYINIDARVENSDAYDFCSKSQLIHITNSDFADEDIIIVYEPKNNKNESITFESDENGKAIDHWKSYLNEHDFWINGSVYIKLSDVGKQYYNKVCVNNGESGEEAVISQNNSISEYILWTEHTERNADTSKSENGTRSFTMGVDVKAPESKEFNYSKNYFEPTKTDTCQYYASEFVLSGSFMDDLSGVSKIEYTIDYNSAQDMTEWTQAAVSCDKQTEPEYKIILGNGDYKAIAIRAYDNAGNVSDTVFLKNDKGEFINIIVDDTVPQISVESYAEGILYNGENENWINKPITYNISYNPDEAGIAGIYQYEYAYQTILDSINGNALDEWKVLNVANNEALAEIAELTVGKDTKVNKNGYYCFQAVSKSGVKTTIPIKKRILLQQCMSNKKPVIVTGVSDKYNNEWYNKESGTPIISFEYPDYDNGNTSGEYEAPVILHYSLIMEDEAGNITELVNNATAMKGVNKKEDFANGKFNVTADDLTKYKIDFGFDKSTGYATDGIYTLEYWISDKALNESKKEILRYKIDCHEPTELLVKIADAEMAVDSEEMIVYQSFYQKGVAGSVSAKYGISGKGSLQILKAKKIGEWQTNTGFEDGEAFEIPACSRCFVYVSATDKAGNKTEGWTRGVVVDDLIPTGDGILELVLEPKGANEHGFYNKDIEIEVRVNDAPDNDNCAALMSVSSNIGKDGNDTISGKELFSFTKELPTNEELSEAQSFNTTQLIDAKVNESNNAYIDVTAVDRSGNKKTSTQVLKIDVTKPLIDITFDNNNALNESYFNQSRIATIHINELNFNAEYVIAEITRDGVSCELPVSEWTHNENDHYATIAFTEDGDYTLTVQCKDLADNESETVYADAFTIDKTLPQTRIELDGDVSNEFYYNSQVTAIITVSEHNFNENDFVLKLSDNSNNIKVGEWTHNDDIHTTYAVFNSDGNYNIVCEYTDKAGNSPESFEQKEFVIDTVLPVISISGVKDGSANSDEVTPVITILDLNVSQTGTNISVTTGKGESVEVQKTASFIGEDSQKEYQYTLTDMTSKEDNIYYLEVSTADLAGNEDTLTYRFSLNRNGSTYDINDFKLLTEKYYNSYSMMEDLEIYEMNVDKVEDFNIYMSRNGELLSGKRVMKRPVAKALINDKQIAYSVDVSGDDNTGYTYKYTIYKENFAEEGTYRMGLYSKDRAGNEVNNTLEINGEDISFVIDATQPKVVIEGIESGKLYDTESQAVNVMVSDNFKLNEAEFILVNSDGDELEAWDYYELVENEGEVVSLTIPQYNEEVSLLFRAKDAAGNEILTLPDSKTAVSDVLITTDKWTQMLNKPAKSPVAIIVIAIIAGVLAVQIFMAFWMSKKAKK